MTRFLTFMRSFYFSVQGKSLKFSEKSPLILINLKKFQKSIMEKFLTTLKFIINRFLILRLFVIFRTNREREKITNEHKSLHQFVELFRSTRAFPLHLHVFFFLSHSFPHDYDSDFVSLPSSFVVFMWQNIQHKYI